MKRTSIICALLAVGTMGLSAQELPKNGVVMEVWENIKGRNIADLVAAADTRQPNAIYVKSKIDEIAFGLDHFGARFSALLTAPKTGEYTFYIAADDAAELLLSTDEDPANLQKICGSPSWMKRHDFKQGQTAGKVSLKKGQRYYLVVNFKDAQDGEHVALAWEGPGMERKIIGKKYFTPVLREDRKQIWQHTDTQESLGMGLVDDMLKLEPEKLAAWLDALSAPERNVLNARMQKLFSSLEWQTPEKNRKMLQPYVNAATGIKASPKTPITNPVAKTLLQIEDIWLNTMTDKQLAELGAHRLAPSLGKIAKDAKTVKGTVRLSSAPDKWREEMVSTGFYAAPGKPVTVKIPAEYVGKNLVMQVGHHMPQRDKALVCMPNTTKNFKLDKEKTTFITPHGGLMLLKVPREVVLDNTPIAVSGALKAPRFVLGQDTDADWAELKKAPAPWGELVSEHVVLIVDRDTLQKLENPTAVMTWWNTNNGDLEDFYSYYPKVPFRMHAGHYAEEGLSWWPLQWAPQNMAYLLNLEAMQKQNSALFLHEHGHHCDFWEMELSFWEESTTNWGGYYMKAREGKSFDWKDSHDRHLRNLFDPANKGMQEIMQDNWYKDSSKGTHHWSYAVTSMMIGYAEEFGWDCVKATIKRIRDTKGEMYTWDFVQGADADQAKIDRYLIGLSEAAQRDVRPYYAHFKMFPSAGAAKHLDALALPKWDLSYLAQPETTTTKSGTALSIPCGNTELLSFAKGSEIKWKSTTAQGGKVKCKGGKATYTPAAGFTGVDTLTYQITNECGQCAVKTLKITVE